MNSLRVAAILLIVSALGGCGGAPVQAPPLEGARIGGAFSLTDQNGRTVTDRDFAGRWRIMYFGYTYCPDVCPTDMLKLGQAMKLLDKQAPGVAKQVAPVFVSVDPARDTPAVLKQYVDQFDSRFTGLTGSEAAIRAVTKQYAVAYEKQVTPSGYLIGHTQIAYLMDPQGKPITSLPIEAGAEQVADEIKRWVR
jgi:protein SCO1